MIAPVGQASRQPAFVQCLQTSLIISQRLNGAARSAAALLDEGDVPPGGRAEGGGVVVAHPGELVVVAGSWFHCLQATSHALQPMQSVVSVKKPLVIAGRLF